MGLGLKTGPGLVCSLASDESPWPGNEPGGGGMAATLTGQRRQGQRRHSQRSRTEASRATEKGVDGTLMRRPWPAPALGRARVKAKHGGQRENGR